MIDKVSLDKFITGEGDDEYENQYTMDGYEQQYKESQDAVRKYADDVRRLEAEVKEKERIIQKLKDAGYEVNSKSHTLPDIKGLFKEVNRPEYEAFGCQHNGCDKPISKRYA